MGGSAGGVRMVAGRGVGVCWNWIWRKARILIALSCLATFERRGGVGVRSWVELGWHLTLPCPTRMDKG